MLNTDTCFRFDVIIQLVYYQGPQNTEESWMWARTCGFSSNLIVTVPQPVLLGALVCGILTPTFGTHLTTQLESFVLSSTEEWCTAGIGGVPHPRNFDLDPETRDGLPVLGGSAFDIQSLRYAISGVRVCAPDLDPHFFHRKLAAEKKEREGKGTDDGTRQTKSGRTVSVDPRGVDDIGYRKTSKELYAQVHFKDKKRDESVLAHARRTHSRRQKSEDPHRGRSPGRRRPQYTSVGRKNLDPKTGP